MVPAGTNPLAGFARVELDHLRRIVGPSALDECCAIDLLETRSHYLNLTAQPNQSPTGHCRFLQATDGPIAIHLARDDDWALLPAWLQTGASPNDWASLAQEVANQEREVLLQQGITLGLAVASPNENLQAQPLLDHLEVDRIPRPPRVLDLSTLWAGPLCGQLLRHAGGDVIKVDSAHRPDGARAGNQNFYEHLNGGKTHQIIDFRLAAEKAAFVEALATVDIVIESARPRALPQLGIDPLAMLKKYPHLTWVSITAYGRNAFDGMRIGYGDDVGIAAGLSAALHAHTGRWDVVGDALADPLTGIRAAKAAIACFAAGGGRLLDVSLVGSIIAAMNFAKDALSNTGLQAALARWQVEALC